MLALGAFAGLRDAEIKRLDWSVIDLRRGSVELKAGKAKTARRRIIHIQPNLAAWRLAFVRPACPCSEADVSALKRICLDQTGLGGA